MRGAWRSRINRKTYFQSLWRTELATLAALLSLAALPSILLAWRFDGQSFSAVFMVGLLPAIVIIAPLFAFYRVMFKLHFLGAVLIGALPGALLRLLVVRGNDLFTSRGDDQFILIVTIGGSIVGGLTYIVMWSFTALMRLRSPAA